MFSRKTFALAALFLAIIAVFLWHQYGNLVPIMLAQDRERAALPKWSDGTNGITVLRHTPAVTRWTPALKFSVKAAMRVMRP